MEIDNFIEHFASLFEETPINKFEAITCFRDIGEWDSMIALTVMAMIDENYQVTISPNEMKQANTIQELFELVKSKNKM
jgi:acyl carrier protein